jgi:hypothetical protein
MSLTCLLVIFYPKFSTLWYIIWGQLFINDVYFPVFLIEDKQKGQVTLLFVCRKSQYLELSIIRRLISRLVVLSS